jgi:hypothetical protein
MLLKTKLLSFLLLIAALPVWAVEPTESLPIPSAVQFAGQTISLERYDMRERYDREQIVIAFQHSMSLLLIKRANRYFPIIEPILKANGIPDDFKYLAVIESNLDVRSLSPVQAAGLWQLMPKTAEQFGLEVNAEVDERYHIVKSTEAACKYLKSAYNKYKSWTSTAVSYNAGMGRITSEQNKQLVDDALDMYLTSESSRYLFRILAMKQFLENPARFGYKVNKNDFYHTVDTKSVVVSDSVGDWARWAATYGISYAQLKDFNSWLRDRKLTNTKKKTYTIDVPLKEDLNFKSSKIKIHPNLVSGRYF